MPTHQGIEVWLEDSEHRIVDHHGMTINLVDSDDRSVTVKTRMLRNELYTVHCRSPISIFCDVFVTAASRVRTNAATFYLDKNSTLSERVSGSSIEHAVEQFQDHELRMPKRKFQNGSLGVVEVEIRRIGEIIKREPSEERVANENSVDFIMIDEPCQPPWIVFRFEISVKESSPTHPSTGKRRGRLPHKMLMIQGLATGSSSVTSHETEDHFSCRSKKRPRGDHNRSAGVGECPIETDSNIFQEYQEEQAEERRLLQKLQDQLHIKRARNIELRRLLGETE